MSRKKINKRLDTRLNKLFDEIKDTEAEAQSSDGIDTQDAPEKVIVHEADDSVVDSTQSLLDAQESLGTDELGKPEDPELGPSPNLTTAFRTDEKSWATLNVIDDKEHRTWGTEERMLIKQVADQLSLALENARLFQQTQSALSQTAEQAHRLGLLNDLATDLGTARNREDIYKTLGAHLRGIIQADRFTVSSEDSSGEGFDLIALNGSEVTDTGVHLPYEDSFIEKVVREQRTLAIPGDGVLSDFSDGDEWGKQGIQSMIVAPLTTSEKVIGTLNISAISSSAYSEADKNIVGQVAALASATFENLHLIQETRRRAEELAALNEIMSAAGQSLDLQEILDTTLQKVFDVFEFEAGMITIFNEERKKLERVAAIGMPGKAPEDSAEGLEGSLCEVVFQSGETLAIADIREGAPSEVSAFIEAGLYAYLGIPLFAKGKVLGTLCVFRGSTETLTDEEMSLAHAIANQLGFTIENAILFEESLKFRLGMERSSDAVFMTTIDGTIVYANPGFEKVYGYPIDEVIGENPRIIKSGLLSQEQYKEFWETLLNKETVAGEITNQSKDGKLIPVNATNSPILDDRGNILGFLAIHSDISQRKEAEEALRRRNEYLSASAEIGRLVTSTLDLEAIFTRAVNLVIERFGYYHAGIFIVEENGVNAVLEEATGVAGAQMKEQKHALAVGSNSIVGQATANGEPVIVNNTALDPTHHPNPLLPETKAEAALPLKVGIRIIGALDIQSTDINAFSQDDIAILQLLADQIAVGIDNARSYNIAQQAVEEMREVDRLKSQFLANMSHELRTPLNSIIGFARVILKGIDGPITELQQQDLTAIFNSGQHLLGLINDILDLSRIEAGKMDLTFDEVNLNDLIASVMSTAAGLVKDKPIELKRDIAADMPLIRADAMRIRQVLINFLSNAAKFTEEGEIIVQAYVDETPKEGPVVMVSVSDTGPGIAREDQGKLFQPFSQVDASLTRKVGGSGLGLSICNHLVQMHGGKIGVHSSQGKGSTFYFSIPVHESPIELDHVDGEKTILAIDDDPQIISLYKRYLEPRGYQVVGLNDPSQAKKRAEEMKPFAITLDVMMPGYDGWQVLTELKSTDSIKDIPVIVCSIVEDEDKGFSLGAADYLIKPILENDLIESIARLDGDGSIREVLVIDDDPNDLRLLGKMISDHGKYKAILAEGGPAGWKTINSKLPHAIVLDLFMPDMDGFTILEKLRENHQLRDIPVVIITGGDLTKEQQEVLGEFGQRLLQKSSLKEEELISTIANALHRIKVE